MGGIRALMPIDRQVVLRENRHDRSPNFQILLHRDAPPDMFQFIRNAVVVRYIAFQQTVLRVRAGDENAVRVAPAVVLLVEAVLADAVIVNFQ